MGKGDKDSNMRSHLLCPQVAQVVTQWERNASSCHRHTGAGQPGCPAQELGRDSGRESAWEEEGTGAADGAQPTHRLRPHCSRSYDTTVLGNSSSSRFLGGSLSCDLMERREGCRIGSAGSEVPVDGGME